MSANVKVVRKGGDCRVFCILANWRCRSTGQSAVANVTLYINSFHENSVSLEKRLPAIDIHRLLCQNQQSREFTSGSSSCSDISVVLRWSRTRQSWFSFNLMINAVSLLHIVPPPAGPSVPDGRPQKVKTNLKIPECKVARTFAKWMHARGSTQQ